MRVCDEGDEMHLLANTFDPYVKLAADDVSRLRFCDVDRVMEQATCQEELEELTHYLLAVRPDFDVAEVVEIEHDICKEKGWNQ